MKDVSNRKNSRNELCADADMRGEFDGITSKS